ncbi:MAG: TetR/AcrR family transcriptional regulator [Roseovarius sp.]
MARASPRLTARDWLNAGLEALSEQGPSALKAEPLAVRLGVSKGSFYWHFRDVPAFHDALLAAWQADSIDRLPDLAAPAGTDAARLRNLAQAFAAPDAIEPAVRAWASSDDTARAAVDDVDTARLAALRNLLSHAGIDNPEMARILYASAIGMTTLGVASPADHLGAIGSLVDLVLALR